jgi:CheY-like chemotaxis protein
MSYVLQGPRRQVGLSARGKAVDKGSDRRTSPPCVLLIDDDAAIRLLCSVNLRALGIEVLEAEDGSRGFELARRKRPDLVLLDVSMPGLDGFQVAELVRGHRRTRRIPLMFLSGEEGNDARARELGAIACLAKPFDPVALASLIAATVNSQRGEVWA